MKRTKIDYGIDLGTTNSSIARMTNGEPKIVKSEKYQKDTTPSCINFNKKKTQFIGDDASNKYRQDAIAAFKNRSTDKTGNATNSFIEFKRTMGTDKRYTSSHMEINYSSENLSAEILKKLKSYVRDEDIKAAIITVPAKFRQSQVDATKRAADLAGFAYSELLQEPIAASLAYGVDAKKTDGYWLVFDFGGGTFDAALMKVDEGVMKVIDTDGDNYLGGKNLDYAIVDNILIPYLEEKYAISGILDNDQAKTLLCDALKWMAEEAKIELSTKPTFNCVTDEPIGEDDDGNEMELDIRISLADYEEAISPIFQRSIDISNTVLSRNNLRGEDLTAVILIGGPTFSQTLRRLLREQLSPNIDTSIDPMTAVALGAALYASTRDIPRRLQERDNSRIQLTLKYPETTVEQEVTLGVRVDRNSTKGHIPGRLFIEVGRIDKGWSSGRIEIVDDAEIIQLILALGKANSFSINLFDEKGSFIDCEPDQINIIQGLTVAQAVLPRTICIEILDAKGGKQRLQEVKGLLKNQPLPAKGKAEYLKTQQEIRPGNKQDIISIPIYEGENRSRAIFNAFAGKVIITGEDISQYLPKDSEVEITISKDASGLIETTTYFPYIDETINKQIKPNIDQSDHTANHLTSEIDMARKCKEFIEEEYPEADEEKLQILSDKLYEIEEILEKGRGDYDARQQVMERLREVQIEMDKLEAENKWPQIQQKLLDALKRVNLINERYGNEKSGRVVEQFNNQVSAVIDKGDPSLADTLLSAIKVLDYELIRQDPGFFISYIKYYDEHFNELAWKNRSEAKKYIATAKQEISQGPTLKNLEALCWQLWELLPDTQKHPPSDTSLLTGGAY